MPQQHTARRRAHGAARRRTRTMSESSCGAGTSGHAGHRLPGPPWHAVPAGRAAREGGLTHGGPGFARVMPRLDEGAGAGLGTRRRAVDRRSRLRVRGHFRRNRPGGGGGPGREGMLVKRRDPGRAGRQNSPSPWPGRSVRHTSHCPLGPVSASLGSYRPRGELRAQVHPPSRRNRIRGRGGRSPSPVTDERDYVCARRGDSSSCGDSPTR